MSGRFFFALAAAVTLALPSLAGTLENDARPAADAIFASGKPPAMVIAVVRGDETFIAGYGETAPGNKAAPNGRSLVRIASLSKLLTADVLAAMVADGKVGLSDALQEHAPPDRTVPMAKSGEAINLLSLATHTSGLAREASGPRWDWLERQTLKTAPGMVASYSNVAFDLLGDALAASGGAPYPDLLARTTTAPLGMRDTTPSPNTEQCQRMIRGGMPAKPCADQADIAGNGGIYSTAEDMALWLHFQMATGGDAKAEPRRTTMQRIYFQRDALTSVEGLDHAGKAAGIGLAWILLIPEGSTVPLLEKTGNIGGFLSYVAMSADRKAAVFVSIARPAKPGKMMKAIVDGVNTLTIELASRP